MAVAVAVGCGLRNNDIYEYIPFCMALSLSLLYSIVCVRVSLPTCRCVTYAAD